MHARRIEDEAVRAASTRGVRSRRPVITGDAGVVQVLTVRSDVPAADEVERAPSDIITTSGDGRTWLFKGNVLE